jgi:sulfate permease, SulP family
MMAGLPLTLGNLATLLQPEMLVHWLPGLILALLMFIVTCKSNHFVILPAFLVGGVLLFFVITWIAGISLVDLSGGGWLLSNSTAGETAVLPPLSLSLFGQINWTIIAGQAANMLAIMAVSAIGLLLNVQSLELVTDHDLDVNHELQVAGAANILAGLIGGLVGYQQLSVSMLNFKIGSKSRLSGVISAAICLLAFFSGVTLLSFFPKIIIGSLLVYLGLNFLYEWVIEGFLKLPRIDYAIVIIILIVTISAGFLEAVVVGLLLAVILFVVSYSQIDVIHQKMDGASYRSRVTRTRLEENILLDQGRRIYILQLQGFVFFGTANNLLHDLRKRLLDPEQEKPEFIILDFKRVTGLDSTGLLSFKRMKQLMEKEGIVLLFTKPNGRVLDQIIKHGLDNDGHLLQIFPRLDLGMERCEERILSSAGDDAQNPPPLEQQLQGTLFSAGDDRQKAMKIKLLLRHFERLEIAAGQVLIKTGDPPDNLYFIESGQLTAQLHLPGRVPIRLETSGSGNVFGEIGFYLGTERTADVIAETPCVVYRISIAELQKLERTHPEAASTLHQINAYLLAERMINKTVSIKSLES